MISLFLLIFAGICKAVMDTLQFHYGRSVFSNLDKHWWNPDFSWMNKWKHRDRQNGERFFGSSTFLVWTTDAWHFFQHLMILSIMLSIVTYTKMFGFVADFFILYLTFTIVFEIFYSKIFTKKT